MPPANTTVAFREVGTEPSSEHRRACRATLVGPGHNEPEPYEGYNGFVGWSGVTRLRSGRWLVTFTSGLWHASFPWTREIAADPANRAQFDEWAAIGLPDLPCPSGGRAHVMHSDDEGRTWSTPTTLVNTDRDDRHPTILELPDGTLLCTWFASRYPRVTSAWYMLSRDGGATWSEPLDPAGENQEGGFGNGSAVLLGDGSVLWAISGSFGHSDGLTRVRLFRSTDNGAAFDVLSTVEADHDLHEPTIASLPDGRLVLVARREGDMAWSDDGGATWAQSGSTGWGLYDPHLVALNSGGQASGILALFAGSYHAGGIRVLLNPDGGHTWNGPGRRDGKPYGYSVDPEVYGYCHPVLLDDGTIYLVYLHTGGHKPEDARSESLFALRVGVRDGAEGIEILPAPGSPADLGEAAAGGEPSGDGGDPELGDRM